MSERKLTETAAVRLTPDQRDTLRRVGVQRLRDWLDGGAGIVHLGTGDLMAVSAVRYCMGRRTYVTADCADWLIEIWPGLKETARAVIRRDLEQAFVDDDEARARGDGYKPLGDSCDRAEWERVRRLWA